MRANLRNNGRSAEAGFSLVEMLMTAFVMAVGLLGLAMLQIMSMRISRGSQNLSTAVLITDRVMDQVEMEGRLGWLNITSSNYTNGAMPALNFMTLGTVYVGYDKDSQAMSAAPVAAKPTGAAYVVTVVKGADTASGTGRYSDFRVTTEFTDTIDQTGTTIVRNVTVTRRILHG